MLLPPETRAFSGQSGLRNLWHDLLLFFASYISIVLQALTIKYYCGTSKLEIVYLK